MKFYPKVLAMLVLLVFFPPIGLIFMYKFSPFDRKTNFLIAAACIAFFVNTIVLSPDFKNIVAPIWGEEKAFSHSLTPEEFREKFNAAARKLAPNLGLEIDAPFTADEKSFRHEFTPKLILEGALDGDGQITALKIFTAPDTKDESFQAINVLGLLIAALNPELDQDDRSEVFRDLRMLKEVSTEGSYDWTTTRGRVKYSVHSDSGKSVFTAELQ